MFCYILLAFGLAAASFFPVIILGIFDKRINREGAISGMIVGLAFTTFYIIGVKFYGMPTWFLGISPEGIGTLGIVMNFIVTYTISPLTPLPALAVQEMVEYLRSPELDGAPLSDLRKEQLD